MSLGGTAILDAIVSHAMTLGLFEHVNGHEPTSPPGNGLTCAVWVDQMQASPVANGLATTTAHMVLKVRIYTSMITEPQDAIDPNVLNAVDVLWAAYIGDLTLGDLVMTVDIKGMAGVKLNAQAGYLPVPQGSPSMRVMTITLPLLVSDVWTEAP